MCGEVASTRYALSADGEPTFLNLERPYPNQILTALIWGDDRPPEEYFRESAYQCRWSRPLRKPPRRESPLGTVRRARVHRKSHELAAGHFDYPMVRLTGLWLEDAGFLQGQHPASLLRSPRLGARRRPGPPFPAEQADLVHRAAGRRS